MQSRDRVVVGVVGCGYWGPNHIRNMLALESKNVIMRVAADPDPARRQRIRELYPKVDVVDDAAAVFEDPEVSAVIIATPVNTHHRLARAALLAGKHVLVEKPMVTSVPDGEDLVALADECGATLMAGHTFEYTAAVNRIRQLIETGELGEILYVRSLRVNLGLYQRDVNVLWDLAPHDISILHYVLGVVPTHVSAVGRAHVGRVQEDIVSLTLHYPESNMANVIVSWLDPRKVREMTIVGSKKMLVYDDVSTTEKIRIFDKGVDQPSEYDSFGEFQFSYRYGDIVSPMLDDYEPLREESHHFIECIRSGKRPRSDGHSALAVTNVLAAAQLSLEHNGRMTALDDPAVRTVDGTGRVRAGVASD